MILNGAKLHGCNAIQQLYKTLISLGNGATELIAVYIKVIKQTSKAILGCATLSRAFNVLEYHFQQLIEIVLCVFSLAFTIFEEGLFIVTVFLNITEQLTRKNKEAFFFYQTFSCFLGLFIGHLRIVKLKVASFVFTLIDVIRKILRNISVEHCAQHIIFEVPSIHCTTEFIGNGPNSTMEFISFLFFFIIDCHHRFLLIYRHWHSGHSVSKHLSRRP